MVQQKPRLEAAAISIVHRAKNRYIGVTAKLDAMSPLKVLTRGYSLVQNENDTVIRSVSQVQTGERIRISLSDGTLSATVMEKKEAE